MESASGWFSLRYIQRCEVYFCGWHHGAPSPVLGVMDMYGVVIGVLLVLLKVAEVDPVAGWSWWLILTPLGLAVLWWEYADRSGLTKRREIDKMEDRKKKRRADSMAALGMDERGRRGKAKR
jgi:small Trp-rich protein